MRPMTVTEPMEAPSMAPAVQPPSPEADLLPALRNVLGQEVAAMGAPEQVAPPPAPTPVAEPTVAPVAEPTTAPAEPVAAAVQAAAEPAVVEEVAALLGVAPADVQMAVGSMTPESVTGATGVTGGEGTGVTATRPDAEYAAREAGVQAAQSKVQQAQEQLAQQNYLQMQLRYTYDPESGMWMPNEADTGFQPIRAPSPQQAQEQMAAAQQELAAAQATPAMLSTETAQADLQTQLRQALGGMAGGGAVGAGVTGAPMAGGGMAGGIVGDLQQRLLRQLGVLEEAPSRFESEGFVKAREAALANLEAQYGAERSRLEEELARRGLSASSIAAGRMGDLAGQQARALATMEADLLKEAAMTEAQDRALLLQNYQQLLSTMSEDERAKLDRDLKRYEIDGTLGMRANELQQEAALRGRSMDIEEALGLARIDIARQEIAQRDRQFEAELGLKRETLTADQEYRMQQLQISRDELAIKKDQLEQQNKQFYDSLTETQRNNLALEELSRERNTLSREELTQRQTQWQQEQTQRESINRINAIVQLSPFLADMTAEDAVRFFSSLGIPINADIWKQVKSGSTTGTTGTTGTGGTGGTYGGSYPSTGATGGYYPGTTLV